MNAIAIVVLLALLLEFALGLAADLLNLRSLRPELPEELRADWDAAEYRRSQEYTRARTCVGLVRASLDLGLLLAFWGLGGFDLLDQTLRKLGLGPIPTGLLYFGALGLATTLVGLPLQLHSTFVIEERFGFNRTDARTFWSDLLKRLSLAVVLGGPLAAAVLYFLEATGAQAWLWCWGATTAFGLLALVVGPAWIMPLFNEFRPLGDGELRSAVLDYARSTAFPLEDVFVMDGSKRSTKANAFFTGLGRHKRVALFDTLIEQQSTQELVAVVAHEVGHFKRRHLLKHAAISIAHFGILFWLLSVFLARPELFEAFAMQEPSAYAGLVLFGLLCTPIETGISLLLNALSRRNELEADAFAARTTGRAEALVSALKKLSAENLSNLTPHPLHVLLYHSHPPLLRRIAALRNGGRP